MSLVLTLSLLLALLVPADFPAPTAGGSFQSPLPLPVGDWIVRTPLVLSDVTLTLRGDLVIAGTGSLDLRGVTLRLEGNADGDRAIRVQPGGRLRTRLSPVTFRRTRIEKGDGSGRFSFEISRGAHVQLFGTSLRGAGWSDEHPGLVIDSVPGSEPTITDCDFSGNFVGVTVRESGHEILFSRFAGNERAAVVIDRGAAVVRFVEMVEQPVGIDVGPESSLVLEGSFLSRNETALLARRAALDVGSNLFIGNDRHAVSSDSDAWITDNLFAASRVAVQASGGGRVGLRRNDLVGNALAVRNENPDPEPPVDARENWWGSEDGPGGVAGGGGDPVTEGVLVSPWCHDTCRGRSDA